MLLRPDTLALTALLALLTAVGPMSVDFYLPSLPEIGRVFGAPAAQVQLTLSGYLLCFAIGQIVSGPISDHVGRKPVLLAALTLYVAVCLGCVFAASIEMLIALRCLQALGVAAAPVLAPNKPSGSDRSAGETPIQSTTPVVRSASSGISNRNSAVTASVRSSGSVNKSNSIVPS